MENILEIIAVLIVCGTFIALVWLAGSLVVTPVPVTENTKLFMLIACRGDGAGIEQTLQGLSWLRDEGRVPMSIIIADCGLDDEGQKTAELAGLQREAAFCNADGIAGLIGDLEWTKDRAE